MVSVGLFLAHAALLLKGAFARGPESPGYISFMLQVLGQWRRVQAGLWSKGLHCGLGSCCCQAPAQGVKPPWNGISSHEPMHPTDNQG